jgi:hypothetical protein
MVGDDRSYALEPRGSGRSALGAIEESTETPGNLTPDETLSALARLVRDVTRWIGEAGPHIDRLREEEARRSVAAALQQARGEEC